jgi:AraC-like DNA-binding protein
MAIVRVAETLATPDTEDPACSRRRLLAAPDRRLAAVAHLLDRRLAARLDLAAISATVNLSVPRLQHLFRRHAGTSIRQYLSAWRLHEARRLLDTTHLRISEIGYRTGFQSASGFVHAFRKRYGLSPRAWRRQQTLTQPPEHAS